MFVLSLDDGRNSLAHLEMQRDRADMGPDYAAVWQLQLQPLVTGARPPSYPHTSAQVDSAAFVLGYTLTETLPSTNTSY